LKQLNHLACVNKIYSHTLFARNYKFVCFV